MSVHNVIESLPGVSELRQRSLSLAVLDALMSPDWESRCHSFDAGWGPGEQMASMRDGSGDQYAIVFNRHGAWAHGFAHESPMSPYRMTPPASWPGLLDQLPEAFAACATEPAFCIDGVLLATTCFWRLDGASAWACGAVTLPAGQGADPDGASDLFSLLVDGTPSAYMQYAADYFEVHAPRAAVEHVYAQRPLTAAIAREVNPDLDLDEVAEELAAMGYPLR